MNQLLTSDAPNPRWQPHHLLQKHRCYATPCLLCSAASGRWRFPMRPGRARARTSVCDREKAGIEKRPLLFQIGARCSGCPHSQLLSVSTSPALFITFSLKFNSLFFPSVSHTRAHAHAHRYRGSAADLHLGGSINS